MSKDLTIKGAPFDVDEPISGMVSNCGSLISVYAMLGHGFIHMCQRNPHEIMRGLEHIIAECDKGNEGQLSDQFAVECDRQWSDCASSYDAHKRSSTNKSYEVFTGEEYRRQLREKAVRFWLYYKAGLEVIWS